MSNISMKSQFRQAAKAVCQPQVEYQQEEKGNTKSYTQVANLVLPPNSGALKREGIPSGVTRSRPNPLTIRLSEKHKEIIRSKAHAAGITVNEFARAVMLGSDYKPPLSAELFSCLLDLHRELTRQGTNLNQIARQLNAGILNHDRVYQLLAALAPELTKVYAAIYATLANGRVSD